MALSRDELRAELKRLRDLAASNGEWTMAQDAKLQSVMEGFRARLAQRTTEVAAAVSNHDQQIERAHARLCNVCNEFDLLSHTQFMEHRVYDDGEAPADAPSASAEEAPPADAAEPTDATLVKECAGLVQVGVRATAAFPARNAGRRARGQRLGRERVVDRAAACSRVRGTARLKQPPHRRALAAAPRLLNVAILRAVREPDEAEAEIQPRHVRSPVAHLTAQ